MGEMKKRPVGLRGVLSPKENTELNRLRFRLVPCRLSLTLPRRNSKA